MSQVALERGTGESNSVSGESRRHVGHVVPAVLRLVFGLSWRRIRGTLTTPGAIALGIFASVALVGLWVWLLPQFLSFLGPVVRFSEVADALVACTVAMSFTLFVAIIRSVMLSQRGFAADLRPLLVVAPLGRVKIGLVQVIPDLLVSAVLPLSLASMVPMAYAISSDRATLSLALYWSLDVICVMGLLTAVVEVAVTKLTGSVSAARTAGALVVVVITAVVLMMILNGVTAGMHDNQMARFLLDLLAWPQWQVHVIGIGIMFISLASWILFAGISDAGLLQQIRRPFKCLMRTGSISGAAFHDYWRRPSNRLMMIGAIIVVALFIWLDRVVNIRVAWTMISWSMVALLALSVMTAFGSYIPLRWRALAAPRPAWKALAMWNMGTTGAALVAIGALVGMAYVYALVSRYVFGSYDLLSEWSNGYTLDILLAGLCAVIAGLVGGRLMPYREGDLLSTASSALLTVAIMACLTVGLPRVVSAYELRTCVTVAIGITCTFVILKYEDMQSR
ncbi:MAG: hypothetical protein LBV30_03085 [Propionibacteriaceae bacterium]|jgi:hypothetical protein|nr:hypothetical protein [Propionibacteriaceae bacterium]